MTRILVQLLFGFLLCCTACSDNPESSTETASNETSISMKGPLPEPEVLTENYQTVVLKGDIPSPQKRTSGTMEGASVAIVYGSPSVRGRKIWGGLEPYGQIWRMGANEATIFEVDKTVKIQGEDLAAGKYALFTIPAEKSAWIVIFNKAYDQWGAFEYDETEDALRVEATPIKLDEERETLEFIIDGNNIAMQWADIHLPFTLN